MNKLIPLAIPCALALILFSCVERVDAKPVDFIEGECYTVFGEDYKFNGEGVK